MKLTKTHLILILIILVGLVFRLYKIQENFYYTHDQDLASWIVRDIVVNKHPRLIGQETSTQGIYIGPIWYYLLIPFYLVGNMNPLYSIYLPVILGIFGILSFYFVFKKIFSERVGLLAGFLYAVSPFAVNNDREVVPTMPVIIWTVWFLYGIYLIVKKENLNFAYLLAGVLVGLIWHLNIGLVLALPTLFLAILLSKKIPNLKQMGLFFGSAGILSLPLIVFELKHQFLQSKYFLLSLTTNQKDIFSGVSKFERVLVLLDKNLNRFISFLSPTSPYLYLIVGIFIAIIVYLIYTKAIESKLSLLIGTWLVTFIAFFSLYSKPVSEYYLNGITVLWVLALSLVLNKLLLKPKLKFAAILFLAAFLVKGAMIITLEHTDKSGFIQKQAIIDHIKTDAGKKGFDCVAISYLTSPGYELGWRYLYLINSLKIKKVSPGLPVYSIVYPQKKYFLTDTDFGAIGLIYPNPKEYTKESVQTGCAGEDDNLKEPIFGFVK